MPGTTVTRTTSAERKVQIVRKARVVFSQHGLHGARSRDLAKACGISEALLFKYFPSKEALYDEVLRDVIEQTRDNAEKVLWESLTPSTKTLVGLVHHLVARFISSVKPISNDQAVVVRLIQYSLMEGGQFAKLLHDRLAESWITNVEVSLQAAVKAGDTTACDVPPRLGISFAYHLSMIVMLNLSPTSDPIDYGIPSDQLIRHIVTYALLGLGVTQAAIDREYPADCSERS